MVADPQQLEEKRNELERAGLLTPPSEKPTLFERSAVALLIKAIVLFAIIGTVAYLYHIKG